MTSLVRLRQTATLVNDGGVIAYPTETVFGLGCQPDCVEAVARILMIKHRPVRAGLIIIGDSIEKFEPWINPTTDEMRRLQTKTNKPTTWIVTAHEHTPGWLTGGRKRIAIRVTDHPVAAALCAAAQTCLVSTSANRRGRRPARSSLQARRWFGEEIDQVVSGAAGTHAQPSEIRDAASDKVIRAS